MLRLAAISLLTSGRRSALSMLAFNIGLALLARGADSSCDTLYNASIKTLQTPHHVYSTKTLANGVKTPSGESIYAGGTEYILLNGSWKRSSMKPQDMIELAREKLKTHPDSCTSTGSEIIDGQPVTAYKVHNNEGDSDSIVWILKSSGLLLGQRLNLGNSRRDVRYEYTNVQPPAGVK